MVCTQKLITAYENSMVYPSAEKLLKIADILISQLMSYIILTIILNKKKLLKILSYGKVSIVR